MESVIFYFCHSGSSMHKLEEVGARKPLIYCWNHSMTFPLSTHKFIYLSFPRIFVIFCILWCWLLKLSHSSWAIQVSVDRLFTFSDFSQSVYILDEYNPVRIRFRIFHYFIVSQVSNRKKSLYMFCQTTWKYFMIISSGCLWTSTVSHFAYRWQESPQFSGLVGFCSFFQGDLVFTGFQTVFPFLLFIKLLWDKFHTVLIPLAL